jgi:hypothetical protein
MPVKGMVIIFDVNDGSVKKVGGIKDFEKIQIEPPTAEGPIAEGKLSLKGIKEVGLLMFSHSSPGCYTVFVNGQYKQV